MVKKGEIYRLYNKAVRIIDRKYMSGIGSEIYLVRYCVSNKTTYADIMYLEKASELEIAMFS